MWLDSTGSQKSYNFAKTIPLIPDCLLMISMLLDSRIDIYATIFLYNVN
jgi:hypothetical protein